MASRMAGSNQLKVVIVGCGIGGLVTAVMLDHAGIEYIILEKRTTHSSVGSAIALPAVVLRVLEQIGLYEDLHRISKEFNRTNVMMEDRKRVGVLDGGFAKARYGYYNEIMARPDLMRILLSRVGAHKIKMGKKVLRVIEHADLVEENVDKRKSVNFHAGSVSVYCSDDSEYKADLVIGCDGAYSTVRQRLYQNLQAEGVPMPDSDFAPFRFDQHCVVGVTRTLNPEMYPVLQKPFCEFEVVLAKDYSYSVWLMPLKNNCISWMINAKTFSPPAVHKKDNENPPEESFIYPEWGPEAAEELCSKVRGFPCPYNNGTIGDLIDLTPKDLISKVMLEDKMFETWHSNRVVLLGDACHKVVPFGGQGATQAILDAVALVQELYSIPSTSARDISRALRKYREKRFAIAQAAVTASRQGGAIFSNKGVLMNVVRGITFKFMPRWLYVMTSDRIQASRPILSFLPAVPDRGSVRAV